MQLNLTKKAQLITTNWAGGTTTQLAIFPPEAEYSKRNFIFRISTATVEIEQSEFTSLPSVSRVLMILKGTLFLTHKNQYSKQLTKFDTDSFSGNWQTTSLGKVTDFNVMTTGATIGNLAGFGLEATCSHTVLLENKFNYTGIYISSGSVKVESKKNNLLVEAGDFLMIIHSSENEIITITSLQNSDVALVKIKL